MNDSRVLIVYTIGDNVAFRYWIIILPIVSWFVNNWYIYPFGGGTVGVVGGSVKFVFTSDIYIL